jgi:diguanylate cyclase (GGDEF)-like protein
MAKRPGKSAGATEASEARVPAHAPSRRHHWLPVTVALLVVGGIVGSLFVATSVADGDAETSRATFGTYSGEIASTLQLAIHDEESMVVNTSAFFRTKPGASNTDFAGWLSSVQAFERYPEFVRVGILVKLAASELPSYAAHAAKDPSGPLAPDGSFQVIPPGDRAFYCFVVAQQYRPTEPSIPAGTDYCADPGLRNLVSTATDSGRGSYLPTLSEYGNGLIVQVPVYSGISVPATIAERRESFVGLVGVQINATLLLNRALQGHDNMAVALRYHDEYSDAQFSSGAAPGGARSVTIDLGNGWTVEAFGAVTSGSLFGNGTALFVAIAGITTVLLAAFGFVIATGRARAMRLVVARTNELRHQALHDALTGLPNRALIMDRIEQLLTRNRRHATAGAVLYVDLDDFKNVNDTLGHEAGDRLLMAVAARLTSTLRDADTIGRMGGDEFVVLLDGAALDVAPELVAERLLEVMRQPFVIEGAMAAITVKISIGVAMGDRASSGDLLRDADVALYQAKAAGKNCYEIFHAAMQTELMERVELEFDLRSAVDDHQFRLVYQPIYNLEDLTIVGVEALLRWQHPVLGVIEPDRFVPILERSDLIHDVGRWALHHACQQTATWHAHGYSLTVSVNVSGRQLDHDSVIEDIRQALDASGLDPSALIIEVTETALMRNTTDTARRLRAIKKLGVGIAVDDFGTGYSSLAYLQQFPVDCLKIDRMFINAINTSPESKAFIGTLVRLGKDLGLRTLAEGVETTGQLDHLRCEHVDEAQGFLMSRPLDAHTLEAEVLHPNTMNTAKINTSQGSRA